MSGLISRICTLMLVHVYAYLDLYVLHCKAVFMYAGECSCMYAGECSCTYVNDNVSNDHVCDVYMNVNAHLCLFMYNVLKCNDVRLSLESDI